MMNKQEFNEYVRDNIKSYLPATYDDATVNIEQIQKNNGIKLDAVVVRNEEVNISPTLYLSDFFNEYVNGKEMHEIMGEIASMQQKYDLGQSLDVSMLTDWNAVKEKIVPRIVNAKENEEMLAGRPHTMMEDLAVVYQIEMGHSEDGTTMSTAVHNGVFEEYGVTLTELHEVALSNIEPVLQPKLMSMRDMLSNMMPDGMGEDMLPPDDPTGMHILTCDSRNHGAAVILNEKTMDMVSEKFGDFYILPSSIHECIILPDDGKSSVPELEALVQDVNETQVAAQEVLSDHVYKYDKETKEIYRADKEAEHLAKVADRAKETTKESAIESAKETKKEAAKEVSKKPSMRAALSDKKKSVDKAKAMSEPVIKPKEKLASI